MTAAGVSFPISANGWASTSAQDSRRWRGVTPRVRTSSGREGGRGRSKATTMIGKKVVALLSGGGGYAQLVILSSLIVVSRVSR